MRLIDADALIAEISNPKYPYTYDAEHIFKRMIDNAPTVDAVQVVRCVDCTYWDKTDSEMGRCWCTVHAAMTRPDWFCWAGYPWEDGETHG